MFENGRHPIINKEIMLLHDARDGPGKDNQSAVTSDVGRSPSADEFSKCRFT